MVSPLTGIIPYSFWKREPVEKRVQHVETISNGVVVYNPYGKSLDVGWWALVTLD